MSEEVVFRIGFVMVSIFLLIQVARNYRLQKRLDKTEEEKKKQP